VCLFGLREYCSSSLFVNINHAGYRLKPYFLLATSAPRWSLEGTRRSPAVMLVVITLGIVFGILP
jgi:hypothetical protein